MKNSMEGAPEWINTTNAMGIKIDHLSGKNWGAGTKFKCKRSMVNEWERTWDADNISDLFVKHMLSVGLIEGDYFFSIRFGVNIPEESTDRWHHYCPIHFNKALRWAATLFYLNRTRFSSTSLRATCATIALMIMGPEFAKVNGLWLSDAFIVYLRTSGKNFCAGDSEGSYWNWLIESDWTFHQ